jgi:DNA-binding GntR family transcriptional regulator
MSSREKIHEATAQELQPGEGKAKQSKVEAVVGRLRHAILTGAVPPGEWLRQDELAQRLGVSSTPVREALRRLEAEGLVEHVPHLGVKVTAYNLNTAREYYELRLMLEPYALRLAAQRLRPADLDELEALVAEAQDLLARQAMTELTEANWRFHEGLLRHCGSRLVQDVLARVRRSFQLDTLLMIPERAGASVSEHQRIVAALRRHDIAAAEREMQLNIVNAREAMLARLPALGVTAASPGLYPGIA